MKRFSRRSLSSFTLVELLAVIAIIAILAGLTLSAFSGVMKSAGRSRARSEIAAMSAAMESYQADNGAYPVSPTTGFNNTNYAADASSPAISSGLYQNSSAALYEALTGQTNYEVAPLSGTKIYMTFKTSQLGNDTPSTVGNPIYIKDPFGNSYGYYSPSTTNNPPVNGLNQFDLWTTGGDVAGSTNTWISNWGLGS
jgi:prepilin-type N-terminal cleavage/methylation domain-containing protein